MEAAAGEFGALSEATVFLNYFKDLPDLRQGGLSAGRGVAVVSARDAGGIGDVR
jgi:hypothetical protein